MSAAVWLRDEQTAAWMQDLCAAAQQSLLFQPDQQNRDRRRRNAGDARSLADGVRFVIVQLGDHLVRQPRNLTVIGSTATRCSRCAAVFDLFLLASDVAFVFDLDLDLFGGLYVVQRRREGVGAGQLRIIHLRAAQRLFAVCFTRQRCFQQRIDLFDVLGVRVHQMSRRR